MFSLFLAPRSGREDDVGGSAFQPTSEPGPAEEKGQDDQGDTEEDHAPPDDGLFVGREEIAEKDGPRTISRRQSHRRAARRPNPSLELRLETWTRASKPTADDAHDSVRIRQGLDPSEEPPPHDGIEKLGCHPIDVNGKGHAPMENQAQPDFPRFLPGNGTGPAGFRPVGDAMMDFVLTARSVPPPGGSGSG